MSPNEEPEAQLKALRRERVGQALVIATLIDTIRDIRLHHALLNKKQGRPLEKSHTIALCDKALSVLGGK